MKIYLSKLNEVTHVSVQQRVTFIIKNYCYYLIYFFLGHNNTILFSLLAKLLQFKEKASGMVLCGSQSIAGTRHVNRQLEYSEIISSTVWKMVHGISREKDIIGEFYLRVRECKGLQRWQKILNSARTFKFTFKVPMWVC